MKHFVRLALFATFSLLLPQAAFADNCSGFGDCYGTMGPAVLAVTGVATAITLTVFWNDIANAGAHVWDRLFPPDAPDVRSPGNGLQGAIDVGDRPDTAQMPPANGSQPGNMSTPTPSENGGENLPHPDGAGPNANYPGGGTHTGIPSSSDTTSGGSPAGGSATPSPVGSTQNVPGSVGQGGTPSVDVTTPPPGATAPPGAVAGSGASIESPGAAAPPTGSTGGAGASPVGSSAPNAQSTTPSTSISSGPAGAPVGQATGVQQAPSGQGQLHEAPAQDLVDASQSPQSTLSEAANQPPPSGASVGQTQPSADAQGPRPNPGDAARIAPAGQSGGLPDDQGLEHVARVARTDAAPPGDVAMADLEHSGSARTASAQTQSAQVDASGLAHTARADVMPIKAVGVFLADAAVLKDHPFAAWLADINPSGSRINAGHCVHAVNAWLEGNPAGAPDEFGGTFEQIAAVYGSEWEWGTQFESVFSLLAQAGAGARGLVAWYSADGSHVLNAVNLGGKPYFVDGSAGLVYASGDALTHWFRSAQLSIGWLPLSPLPR